jgi:type II secretory pathway pseudopilin PulG
MRSRNRALRSAGGGFTVLELTIATALLAVILAVSLASIKGYFAERAVVSWSETLANDIRAAQQLSITRRAPVTVTFTSRAGVTPAGYGTTVGGTTLRRQPLPADMDLVPVPPAASLAPLSLSSLGVPAASVQVRVRHDASSRTRTITVGPVTGTVSVSEP